MKKIARSAYLLICWLAPAALWAQTCATPTIDHISHSVATVVTTCSTTMAYVRINYGPTTSYGTTQGTYSGSTGVPSGYYLGYNLGSLADNTFYHVQLQASPDNATWTSAPDTTFTTAPLPAQHPAYPAKPVRFSVPLPTGPFAHTWIPGGNCATGGLDLQDCYNQAKFGDTIQLPAGLANAITPTVTGYLYYPNAPDATPYTVNVSTGVITVGACPATYGCQIIANDQAIRFGSSFQPPNPLQPGFSYCETSVSGSGAGATFQVYPSVQVYDAVAQTITDTCTGGTALTAFNDSGSTNFYLNWPVDPTRQILVTTADAAFLPPVGTIVDALGVNFSTWYAPHMAYLQASATQVFPVPGSNPLISTHNGNIGAGALAHGWYTRGVALLSANLVPTLTNTDPIASPPLIGQEPDNSYITWEQVWLHGLGYPNRNSAGILYWDGAYNTLDSSTLDMDFWRPFLSSSDATITATSSVLTIGANTGGFWLTNSLQCGAGTPAATITITGGTSSGNGYVFYDMSCVLRVIIPSGLTFTTTGTISVSTNASPAWPVDSNGRWNIGQVGIAGFSSGAILTGYPTGNQPDTSYALDNSEGVFGVDSGYGPGPYAGTNNHIVANGIPWFFSDDEVPNGDCNFTPACPQIYWPHDIYVARNIIDFGLQHQTAGSQHVHYVHRNNFEEKVGQRTYFGGNTVKNNYTDVQVCGPAVLINANGGPDQRGGPGLRSQNITWDFEGAGNYMLNNSCDWNFGNTPGIYSETPAGERFWLHDNVTLGSAWNNGVPPTYGSQSAGFGTGVLLQSLVGWEDGIFTHNTTIERRGSQSLLFEPIETLGEGNNNWGNLDAEVDTDYSPPILYFQGYQPGNGTPSAPDLSGESGAAVIAAGLNWKWGPNVFLCGYSNSQALTAIGQLACTGTGGFSSTYANDIWPVGVSPSARQATVNFFNLAAGNVQLTSASTYISGGVHRAPDGGDMGANIDLLNVAQGAVLGPHVFGVTSSAATVGFIAPDAVGCPVDWSLNSFVTFTRVANAGGARVQNVALTGLPGASNVQGRINCQVIQPLVTILTH